MADRSLQEQRPPPPPEPRIVDMNPGGRSFFVTCSILALFAGAAFCASL